MNQTGNLPRSRPEAEGVASSAILAFLNAAEQEKLELHSLMLLRHGRVVAEGWWTPYGPHKRHILNSLSKSFTSTAVGFAAEEGLLSVDDKVVDYFPEETSGKVTSNLAGLRIRHLLTMSTGHDRDTLPELWGNEGNWVKAFLDCPLAHAPGTHFLYNSGATYVLSAILRKVTNQSLVAYLKPRLFEPLGIHGAVWDTCPRGIETGGWGMRATTEDLAKFGQLYLQKGIWNDRRLLSEAWIREATSAQIANGEDESDDWAQGYGYQFWRCRHDVYRGDGAFGQFCVVMDKLDSVLVVTAGTTRMQSILDLAWSHLLPGMIEGTLQTDEAAFAELTNKLASLKIRTVPERVQTLSPLAHRVSGRRYRLADNEARLRTVEFDFQEKNCVIELTDAGGEQRIYCGADEWLQGEVSLAGKTEKMSARGAWQTDSIFVITVCWDETPFIDTIECHFVGADVELQSNRNVEVMFLSSLMLLPRLTGSFEVPGT